MKTLIVAAALAVSGAAAPRMEGEKLSAGSSCYAIIVGDKPVGSTQQTIKASRDASKPTWDIVVHQRLDDGSFDMRDHFVVDRQTLLPIRMDSQRGRGPSDTGWHKVRIEYGAHRVRGTEKSARRAAFGANCTVEVSNAPQNRTSHSSLNAS